MQSAGKTMSVKILPDERCREFTNAELDFSFQRWHALLNLQNMASLLFVPLHHSHHNYTPFNAFSRFVSLMNIIICTGTIFFKMTNYGYHHVRLSASFYDHNSHKRIFQSVSISLCPRTVRAQYVHLLLQLFQNDSACITSCWWQDHLLEEAIMVG